MSLASLAPQIDISRIDRYAPAELIGRERELALLDDAWSKAVASEPRRPHILTFVALGGEGKTSLVARWLANLAYQGWPGCEAAFAWSFYSQGTREQTAVSSDAFLAAALTFFGDEETANSPKHATEKAKRLAHLVAEKPTLLILDGIEPLQNPPGPPHNGTLKDDGLSVLLKTLASIKSQCLCIVTTRYSVHDLQNYRRTTAPEIELKRLSKEAGIHLLKSLGVHGTNQEFDKLVEDVKGHALTLNLLGAYLHDAHAGDIRHRDEVNLTEADAVNDLRGHAFHVMDTYERWLDTGKVFDRSALALLRLLGLFDGPASASYLFALMNRPPITNLTEPLTELNTIQLNMILTRLENAKLIVVNRDRSGTFLAIDSHPLVRFFFTSRLRNKRPAAWRAAHRRLFEHICRVTEDKAIPAVEDYQPLFDAVGHGCEAELFEKSLEDVFKGRIQHGERFFDDHNVGPFNDAIGSLWRFTKKPVLRKLTPKLQDFVLSELAFGLRAVGRLDESCSFFVKAIDIAGKEAQWESTARYRGILASTRLLLGDIQNAISDVESIGSDLEKLGWPAEHLHRRLTLRAYLSVHAGDLDDARKACDDSLQIFDDFQHDYGGSLAGIRLWHVKMALGDRDWSRHMATEQLRSSERSNKLLVVQALWRLCWAISESSCISPNNQLVHSQFLSGLQQLVQAQRLDHLPWGYIEYAQFLCRNGDSKAAHHYLDEAWEIAERGPMRLFMADIHLYRARLLFREPTYPWNTNEDGSPRGPKDDLAAARQLIEKCGYGRRLPELQDAEAAISSWQNQLAPQPEI